MALSPVPDNAAGYASVAAIAVSLSLAVVVTALMARSVVALRGARSDFERAQSELRLAGDQRRVALAMISGQVTVTDQAQPEAAKINLAAAAALDVAIFSRLGVRDPAKLIAWLGEASARPTSPAALVAADEAPLWKICAPAMISTFGQSSDVLSEGAASLPTGPASHLGEVWRLVQRAPDGWTDERIVRFIGRPQNPAAVIWRRFYKSKQGEGSCAGIFAPTRG